MKSKYLSFFINFFSANFIVKIINLAKEMLFAWIIGPGKLLDIYFFLISFPNMINQILNRSFETTLLARYEQYSSKNNKIDSQRKLANNILLLLLLSFISYILSSILFPFILYFFYIEIFSDIIPFVVAIFNIFIVVETYLLSVKVVKFSENKFFLPTIIPAIQSSVIIFGILIIKDRISLFSLSILFSIGSIFQLLIFYRDEFKIFRIWIAKISQIKGQKNLITNNLYLSFASSITALNLFIDQSFALKLGDLANSYIHYGNYFLSIFLFLFARNINTIIFPQFQKYVIAKEDDKLVNDFQKIVKIVLIVSIIAIIFLFNNGYYILTLILGYGKVSETDIQMIFNCSLAYSGTFIGASLNAVIIRVLHAYYRYKFILKIAIINFTVNILLNYILSQIYGVWGIALSTTLTFFVIVAIYSVYLIKRQKINIFKNWKWFSNYFLFVCFIICYEAIIFFNFSGFIINSLFFNVIIFTSTSVFVLFLLSIFKFINFRNLKFQF